MSKTDLVSSSGRLPLSEECFVDVVHGHEVVDVGQQHCRLENNNI